jgi:hypothetical protein
MSLTDIIYEKINDGYSYGIYGSFKVIVMVRNGYINATKLCKHYNDSRSNYDSPKDFKKWYDSESTKDIIKEVTHMIRSSHDINQSSLEPIIINDSNLSELRGTYIHPSLMPHLCSWVSPKFAIKVGDVVNYHLTTYMRNQNLELMRKIDEHSESTKQQFEHINECTKYIKDVFEYVKNIQADVTTLIDITTEQIESTNLARECLSPTRVIFENHTESMAVIKNKDPSSFYKYKMISGTYTYVKVTVGRLTGTKFENINSNNKDPWLVISDDDIDADDYEHTFVKAYSDIANVKHLLKYIKELIFEPGGINFNIEVSESDMLERIQTTINNRPLIPTSPVTPKIGPRRPTFNIKEYRPKSKLIPILK